MCHLEEKRYLFCMFLMYKVVFDATVAVIRAFEV